MDPENRDARSKARVLGVLSLVLGLAAIVLVVWPATDWQLNRADPNFELIGMIAGGPLLLALIGVACLFKPQEMVDLVRKIRAYGSD